MKFPKPDMVYSGSVSTRNVPEIDESSVASLENTLLTFSSDIHHINQIKDSVERHGYIMNLFGKNG